MDRREVIRNSLAALSYPAVASLITATQARASRTVDSPNLPWINVRACGATGNSTSDDSAAIQAAINACDPNRGGTVFFPQGVYRIETGLRIATQGVELRGEGMPGTSRAQAKGTSRIEAANGLTAITCNPGGAPTHDTLGFAFRQLQIMAEPGATRGNGILVQNSTTTLLEDVTCSDFIGGYGLCIDGGAGNAQYAELRNFSAGDCMTGLLTQGIGPNGIRIFGGYFEGKGTDPRPGSIGIHITTGDTLRLYGTVIQGYETGAYIEAAAAGHEMYGPRFEYCNVCLRIGASASRFSLFGGSFTNTLLEGGGENIGILVNRGATDTLLMPTSIAGTRRAVSDAGTRTRYPGGIGANVSATKPGRVTGRLPYYDATGSLVGYIPIYDAIR